MACADNGQVEHFLIVLQHSHQPSDRLNNYVFCFYRGLLRKHTVFCINPPEEGTFLLKVINYNIFCASVSKFHSGIDLKKGHK